MESLIACRFSPVVVAYKSILHEGIPSEKENPAYTSQTCPVCSLVDPLNRNGDVFLCIGCGHGGHSDLVAATNVLNRFLGRLSTVPDAPASRLQSSNFATVCEKSTEEFKYQP